MGRPRALWRPSVPEVERRGSFGGRQGGGSPCWGPPSPEGRADPCCRPSAIGKFISVTAPQSGVEREAGPRRGVLTKSPGPATVPSWIGGGSFCGGDWDGGGYVEKGPVLEAQVRPGAGGSAPTPEASWATTRSQIWAKLGCREGQARVRALGATWAGAGCCRTLSQDVRPCGVSWCLSCATAVLCGLGLSPSSL